VSLALLVSTKREGAWPDIVNFTWAAMPVLIWSALVFVVNFARAPWKVYEELLISLPEASESEQRRRWEHQFAILPCRLGSGETLQLSWQGPHNELRELSPRTVTEDELRVIHCALAKYEADPVQPRWSGQGGVNVWHVDLATLEKSKLRSPHLRNPADFLNVLPRRDAPWNFCERCGRTSSGSENCTDCRRPLRKSCH
jgi:hypothetical protein